MWKVVYIVQSEAHAQKIKQLLVDNGFMVQIKAAGAKHKSYEIALPFSEAEDAYEVLCDHGFQC